MQNIRKTIRVIFKKTALPTNQPTNRPTNQPIISNNTDFIVPSRRRSNGFVWSLLNQIFVVGSFQI